LVSGVQIAPYWIETPPNSVVLTLGQALTLRAKALGTPKPSFHWYRGGEEIFVDDRITIKEMKDETTVRRNNLSME
jgi:hypothetical protein